MMIVCVVAGTLIGGALFKFGGAVFGALIGWLCGEVLNLRRLLDKQQSELAWLRKRGSEHLKETPGGNAADSGYAAGGST